MSKITLLLMRMAPQPTDYIAGVTVAGLIFLIWAGADGNIKAMLTMILAYYFARRRNPRDA